MQVGNTLRDLALRTANVVHRGLLTLSGGRAGRTLAGMQVVELHTVGRKTGKRRSCMLTSPVYEDDRVVLIASKGGADRHPEWYLNLVADPDVELTIDGTTKQMRARTASPDEKTTLWPRIIEAGKSYADYQRRTDRDIPVVICEPRA